MTRAALVAFLLAALVPAAEAEVLDLGTVKCKDFMASSQQEIGFTIAWLDGFYKDEDASSVIDFDKLKDNAGKLGAYCAQHPDIGVGTAAAELFGG